MTLKLAQEEITLAASAHRQEASHSDGYPRIIQTQLPLAALPELTPVSQVEPLFLCHI